MWSIPQTVESQLNEEGYFIGENMVSKETLQKINDEIATWKNVPAINGYGCQFHSDDALLQNLALYSPTALKLAVSEKILDFMEGLYDHKVLLSKIEYRRALMPKTEMAVHSDGNDDIGIFIYLNGVDPDRGSTALLPRTHKIGLAKNEGYLQVPEKAVKEHGGEFIPVRGNPGTCLFFNSNIWHKRTATKRPGREIIWLSYSPLNRAKECVELVFTRSALDGLNGRQMAALGFGVTGIGNRPGEDFRLSKNLSSQSLYYLSDGFLLRAWMRRQVGHIKNLIPGPIKSVLRALRGERSADQKHYKKINA